MDCHSKVAELRLMLPSISWLSTLSVLMNLQLHLESSSGKALRDIRFPQSLLPPLGTYSSHMCRNTEQGWQTSFPLLKIVLSPSLSVRLFSLCRYLYLSIQFPSTVPYRFHCFAFYFCFDLLFVHFHWPNICQPYTYEKH